MTWVVTAIVTSTAVTAYNQYKQGKAMEEAYEQQAEDAKMQALVDEANRNEQNAKKVAAMRVAQAMSGFTSEGTPAAITLGSVENISESEASISLSNRIYQRQLRMQGENAMSAAKANMAGTLLSGATSVAMYKA